MPDELFPYFEHMKAAVQRARRLQEDLDEIAPYPYLYAQGKQWAPLEVVEELRAENAQLRLGIDTHQAAIRALEAENDRLRTDLEAEAIGRRVLIRQMDTANERLREYATHKSACVFYEDGRGSGHCNCGLYELLGGPNDA